MLVHNWPFASRALFFLLGVSVFKRQVIGQNHISGRALNCRRVRAIINENLTIRFKTDKGSLAKCIGTLYPGLRSMSLNLYPGKMQRISARVLAFLLKASTAIRLKMR